MLFRPRSPVLDALERELPPVKSTGPLKGLDQVEAAGERYAKRLYFCAIIMFALCFHVWYVFVCLHTFFLQPPPGAVVQGYDLQSRCRRKRERATEWERGHTVVCAREWSGGKICNFLSHTRTLRRLSHVALSSLALLPTTSHYPHDFISSWLCRCFSQRIERQMCVHVCVFIL